MNRFKRAMLVLMGVEHMEPIRSQQVDIPDAPDDLYEIAVMAIEKIGKEPGAFDGDEYDYPGHKTWRTIRDGIFSERQLKKLDAIYHRTFLESKRENARAQLMRVAMLGAEAFEDSGKARTVLSAQGKVFHKSP